MSGAALAVERSHGRKSDEPPVERFDVVIVGAGLSGIGAACHLKSRKAAGETAP